MGALNLPLYFGSTWVVTNTSYTGPEGIGSAILRMISLLFSLLLTGFGLRQLYTELFRTSLSIRTVVATLTVAFPLLASVWFWV